MILGHSATFQILKECHSRIVRQVSSAALYHAPCSVQIDPQKEAQEGTLEVVVDAAVVEHAQHVRDGEDGLADGLNVAVLSLMGRHDD